MKISAQEWITKGKQMYFEEFPDSYEILESVKVEFASEEDWIHRRSEIAQLCGEASSKREQVQSALEHDDLGSIQGEFIWGEFGRAVILKTELLAHPGLLMEAFLHELTHAYCHWLETKDRKFPMDCQLGQYENQNVQLGYYEKNGMRWDFGMVVIDELSSFKNYQSQRFKFLRKVRPFVKRWVGLTGTPSSNGLMDLWAEIGILDGGERLGKFIGRYREAYFKAGSMNPATGIVFQYVPRQGAEEMIYQRISDITISMKALDYLNMPDCVPIRCEVEMNTQERELYDMLRQDLFIPLKDGDIDAANAASLTGKLLQMSNGAVYDENGKARVIHDHKLEALEDLIEAANGQPVLVAYWFKHDRERIINHLSKLKIKVRDIKSSTDIKDWNAGNIPVALIHPASAEHGLNIQQGGHILIWFGLTWSLELYQQTNARLWRQGQTHVVTIHHIITKNTVDEDVMAALEQKDMTQEKLICRKKIRWYELSSIPAGSWRHVSCCIWSVRRPQTRTSAGKCCVKARRCSVRTVHLSRYNRLLENFVSNEM